MIRKITSGKKRTVRRKDKNNMIREAGESFEFYTQPSSYQLLTYTRDGDGADVPSETKGCPKG